MAYTPTTWVSGTTAADAPEFNNMETELVYLDGQVRSNTPSDTATPAASGALSTLLNYLATQIRLITGSAHWYSAPVATLASLLSQQNTNTSNIASNTSAIAGKVNKSGDTMSGALTVVQPDILASGHQETGFCALYNGAPSSGQYYGSSINFKTQMSNNPSSITISASLRNAGSSSTFADVWDIYGFRLVCRASSGGVIDMAGTYTTAGNCLLAVDEAAQTFDHHCDICKAVHRQQPLSALDEHAGYSGVALTYTCPDCGATETFDIRMTAADEHDATPQGDGAYATTRGEQARLIRALMRLCGLPTAA